MMADVADYSIWKHGNASTGLIFSSSSMAQKFGGAIGGFILLQVLAFAAYNKDVTVQAPETLAAIKALMSWIPAIGSTYRSFVLVLLSLTTKKMNEIQINYHNG